MTGNRDGQGRFLPGHKLGSPGRPPREVEAQYLETMHKRVSLDDWADVTDRAVLDAKGGDWRAREWLSSYIVRKAAVTLAIEDDDPEGGGLVHYLEMYHVGPGRERSGLAEPEQDTLTTE